MPVSANNVDGPVEWSPSIDQAARAAPVLRIVLDDVAVRGRMNYIVVREGLLGHLLLSVLCVTRTAPAPDLFDEPTLDRCHVGGVVFVYVDGPTWALR